MQRGSIRISGKWWYLKVRENVVENGVPTRKIMYHKLAPVAQFRPSHDGNPPQTIRAMADEKLAPINAGKREGMSADSLKAYLQSYLAAGFGTNGRPVRKITLKTYRRDYNIIRDLIPDIQLRPVRTPTSIDFLKRCSRQMGTMFERLLRIVTFGTFFQVHSAPQLVKDWLTSIPSATLWL